MTFSSGELKVSTNEWRDLQQLPRQTPEPVQTGNVSLWSAVFPAFQSLAREVLPRRSELQWSGGMLERQEKTLLGMEIDLFAVLLLYLDGLAVLYHAT